MSAKQHDDMNARDGGDQAKGEGALQRWVASTGPGKGQGRAGLVAMATRVLPIIIGAAERVVDDPQQTRKFRDQTVKLLGKRMQQKSAERVVDAGIALARAAVEQRRRRQGR